MSTFIALILEIFRPLDNIQLVVILHTLTMPSKQKDFKFTKTSTKKVTTAAALSKNHLPSKPKLTAAASSSSFKAAPVPSVVPAAPPRKLHRTVDSYYDECQCKLYLVAFIALVNAFTCGQASSLSLVLDTDQIIDFYRYQTRQYSLAMALYYIVGNISGASVASE